MKIFFITLLTLSTACSSFAKKNIAPKEQSIVDVETIMKLLKDADESLYGYTPYKIGYMKIGKNPEGADYVWTCEVPGMLIFDQEAFAKVPNAHKVYHVSNAMLACKDITSKNKLAPINKI